MGPLYDHFVCLQLTVYTNKKIRNMGIYNLSQKEYIKQIYLCSAFLTTIMKQVRKPSPYMTGFFTEILFSLIFSLSNFILDLCCVSDRQVEPTVNTLRSPLAIAFWRCYVTSGGIQSSVLHRHHGEEIKILKIIFNFPRAGIEPTIRCVAPPRPQLISCFAYLPEL